MNKKKYQRTIVTCLVLVLATGVDYIFSPTRLIGIAFILSICGVLLVLLGYIKMKKKL